MYYNTLCLFVKYTGEINMEGTLVFVLMIILGVIVILIIDILTYTEKWFSELGLKPNYTFNTVGYNKYPITSTNNYKQPTTLLKNEKHQPPRAEFFGKLDGEESTEEGKYEEQYLNKWELQWWKEQKQREEALKAGILNEIQ